VLDSSDRGSAAVEFALVLPLLLVLVLAVVQIGLFVRDDLVLVGSARAGARQAAVSADDESVRSAVSADAPGLDPTRMEVTIARTQRGGPATVSLTYAAPQAVPFVGWLFPSSVALHATAVMRQEFESR
jgi:Flp pilus assembly protein TadG